MPPISAVRAAYARKPGVTGCCWDSRGVNNNLICYLTPKPLAVFLSNIALLCWPSLQHCSPAGTRAVDAYDLSNAQHLECAWRNKEHAATLLLPLASNPAGFIVQYVELFYFISMPTPTLRPSLATCLTKYLPLQLTLMAASYIFTPPRGLACFCCLRMRCRSGDLNK